MKKKSKVQKEREFWYDQGKRDGKAELQAEFRKLFDIPSQSYVDDRVSYLEPV
jgi:hypothetical protein